MNQKWIRNELNGPQSDIYGPQSDMFGPHSDVWSPGWFSFGPQSDIFGEYKVAPGVHLSDFFTNY